MATSRSGRRITSHASEVLILPSGGPTIPEASAQGQITTEGDKVYIFLNGDWYELGVTKVTPPTPAATSPLEVVGAGVDPVNGAYSNVDADNWEKVTGGPIKVSRIQDYPTPGQPAWAILVNANVLYTAPDCPLPWDAAWVTSSFGVDPAPTVVAAPPTVGTAAKAPAKKESGGATKIGK